MPVRPDVPPDRVKNARGFLPAQKESAPAGRPATPKEKHMHMNPVEIDAGYWDRQLPPDILAKLAENGKQCTDTEGFPREDMDPVPVVRLFHGAGEWLLCCSYPKMPDTVCVAANTGDGWELGDMSLSMLKTMRGPLGLPLERDRLFKPKGPVSGYLEAEH
jgi:hypothetical protein